MRVVKRQEEAEGEERRGRREGEKREEGRRKEGKDICMCVRERRGGKGEEESNCLWVRKSMGEDKEERERIIKCPQMCPCLSLFTSGDVLDQAEKGEQRLPASLSKKQ